MLDVGSFLGDSPEAGYSRKGPLFPNMQEHLQVTKKGNWLQATHLTHLRGGCRRVSSSLKEKWVSDSGPRGNAKAGGLARARGAALERMGAKRRRGRHWGPAAAQGVCGAARQALGASDRRHSLHTCRDLAPGTTPVAPQGNRSRCSRPPHACVSTAPASLLQKGPVTLSTHFPPVPPQALETPGAPVSRLLAHGPPLCPGPAFHPSPA